MSHHWMPFYVGDYLRDTMHLTHAQHGLTGGILYCGDRSTMADRPYCAFHGAIAFRRHVRRWGPAA